MTVVQSPTGILQLRKLRRRVRTTINLVGDGQRITERPGTWWCADMEARRIEWTSTVPFPPYSQIDDDSIRVLCTHEASHIKWSGLYTRKRIKPNQERMFHRFVNLIEDIRVDRLSERQFGGFHDAMVAWRLLMRSSHGNHPEGWCLVDAVGLNAKFSLNLGLDPEGTDLAKEASVRLWPRLDRIANLRSTQEVASALEPIFLELVQIEQAEADRKRREAEEEAKRREEERQAAAQAAAQAAQDDQDSQGSQDAQDDDANSEQNGDPSAGAESEDDAGDSEKGESTEDAAEEGDGRGGGPDPAPDQASAPDDEDGDEGSDAEADTEGVDDEANDRGPGADGQDGEDGTALGGDQDGEQDDDGDEAGQGDDHDGEDTDGDGEPEPEPDPLAGLDSLPNAGADEPTDTPIKSDGDPGTEPLGIGEDLEGMSTDARDARTANELARLARDLHLKKQQARADVLKQLGGRTLATHSGRHAYTARLAEWKGRINVLSQRLKTVLRHNSMTSPLAGQRRGRFDPGKAYRLQMGSIHVFQKPGTVGGLDYTFGLLVDTSHSMFPTEVRGAFDATVLVAEALEKAGLGVFLIFWDDELKHFKPIVEPLAAHRGSIGTLLAASQGGGGTVESPALSLAIDEFEHVPGKRMLITITDGETSTIEESKELLAELEKLGVRTCTIRIGDDPAPHYERGFRIQHADELTRLLPQLINEVVTRAA